MIFLSILVKTYSIALGPHRLWLAIVLWAVGIAADVVAFRKAGAGGPAKVRLRDLIMIQVCALVLGLAAAGLIDYAAMRWKDGIPGFSHLVGLLLQAVGLPAGIQSGSIYLGTMAGPLEFAASVDHLGLLVPVVFLGLAGVSILWTAPSPKDVLRGVSIVIAVLIGATVLRMAFVCLLFIGVCDFVGYETEELPFRPFVDQPFVVLSFLPFLLAAWPLLRCGLPGLALPGTPGAGLNSLPRWLAIGGAPVALVLLLVILWEPAGTPKTGKILINTYHTQWSRTDRPYDRDWYGADSGYNYACLKRLYEKHYDVEELKGRIRASDLDDASVLFVYVPDRAFSRDELRLVHDFVRKGGGLFLIGDHTNVFGSTSHLNDLCEPFGFQFRDDVLFDLDEDFHQILDREAVRSSFGHGMEFFKLRGPASIRPTSLGMRNVFEIDHSKSVRAIYSVNNFYPPPYDHPKMKTGDFCIAAAARHGRGRVVAWADSTVFSNFEIFYPGKYEYLLNSMSWLNNRDSLPGTLLRRLALVAFAFSLAVLLVRRREPRLWLAALVVVCAAWFTARSVSAVVERARVTFPEPVRPMRALFFAMPIDAPGYNLLDFESAEAYDRRYDVFMQWVLRTDTFSGIYLLGSDHRRGYYQALREAEKADAGLALIVRDERELEWLKELGNQLTEGDGQILLMVSQKLGAHEFAQALKESGIITQANQLEQAKQAWPAGESLIEANGRRVLVVASAERFSDQSMGVSEKVVPNEVQRALFGQAFELVDQLFGEGGSDEAAGARE